MYLINVNDIDKTIIIHRSNCLYAKRASSGPAYKHIHYAYDKLEIDKVIRDYSPDYFVSYCDFCKPRPWI
jgi:hypothetical protein